MTGGRFAGGRRRARFRGLSSWQATTLAAIRRESGSAARTPAGLTTSKPGLSPSSLTQDATRAATGRTAGPDRRPRKRHRPRARGTARRLRWPRATRRARDADAGRAPRLRPPRHVRGSLRRGRRHPQPLDRRARQPASRARGLRPRASSRGHSSSAGSSRLRGLRARGFPLLSDGQVARPRCAEPRWTRTALLDQHGRRASSASVLSAFWHEYELSRRRRALEQLVRSARFGEWEALGHDRVDLAAAKQLE